MANLPRFYSNSASSTYEQCPRRWKHKYVDKLPDPPGQAAVLGTFAHTVLEKLCQEPPRVRTVDRARMLASETWETTRTLDEFRALDLDDQELREFRWKAWRSLFQSVPVAVFDRANYARTALGSEAARTFARARLPDRDAATLLFNNRLKVVSFLFH